jgi:hypothetical protein
MVRPVRADRQLPNSPQSRPTRAKSKDEFKSSLAEISTPYLPDLNAHSELLAGFSSSDQRANLITHLQQTYGNRYVQRLLDHPGRVVPGTLQRDLTGLATQFNTMVFSGSAFQFWKDPANRDKPLQALSDHLMQKANAKLPVPCQPVYLDTGYLGGFVRSLWVIAIDIRAFSKRNVTKVGDLNQDEVAEIVNTIYHETRHAEQAFKVAQMKAKEGKNALEIETGMGIPASVAEAAAKKPMEGTTETRGWEAFTTGRYARYKVEIQKMDDEVDQVSIGFTRPSTPTVIAKLDKYLFEMNERLQKFFLPQKKEIEKLKHKDQFDKAVLKHIKEIEQSFEDLIIEWVLQKEDTHEPKVFNFPRLRELADMLHNASYPAYRDMEHEKDAWAVGDKAAATFKERAKITV